MKWQDAKKIPLTDILAYLGHQPTHTSTGKDGLQVWYHSPLRNDPNPSFNVNPEKNVWNDFGQEGGTVIDFIMAYFSLPSVSEVLTKLEDMGFGDRPASLFEPKPKPAPLPAPRTENAPSGLTLKKVQPLQNRALTQYLESRAIPATVAREYVQEAYYRVAGKDRTYFALAFPNMAGGYELRNPYFQGALGSKDISFIPAEEQELFDVMVFEGFFDFLSMLAHRRLPSPPKPVIVLNSVAMKDRAIAFIREHRFTDVQLYLDRDKSGRKLTAAFQALPGLTVADASGIYDGYEDFNNWLKASKPLQRS